MTYVVRSSIQRPDRYSIKSRTQMLGTHRHFLPVNWIGLLYQE
jgi:hypothetical protein